MQQLTLATGLMTIATIVTLCSAQTACADDQLKISTVNYPLAYFAERIERNLQLLKGELLALDERLAAIAGTKPERPLLASHPVYQYLARRYGLNLRSVMWEPEETPSETQWAELAEILRDHPARWMLWEGGPMKESAKRLRQLDVESAVLNPCANRPETGDFLSVMRDNVSNLERVFGAEIGKP